MLRFERSSSVVMVPLRPLRVNTRTGAAARRDPGYDAARAPPIPRLCRMDARLLLTVYGIIFVAELPDKTSFASLLLATRYRPFPVFVGASLALTLQSLFAIAFGHLLSLLPARPVHILSGVLFLGSAIAMWRRDTTAETVRHADRTGRFAAIGTSFVVVFLAEWGDLTQIGTAALAARYHAPLTIFTGATLALWSVVAIVVYLGSTASRALDPRMTKRVAAVMFAIVGIVLMVR